MKKFLSATLLLSVLSIFIYSCNKGKDTEAPVVSIIFPSDTTVIHAGDTVQIAVTATDNKGLHEFFFTLQDTVADTSRYHDSPYVHNAKTHDFNYTWYSPGSSVYRLSVEANDHHGNSDRKEMILTVN